MTDAELRQLNLELAITRILGSSGQTIEDKSGWRSRAYLRLRLRTREQYDTVLPIIPQMLEDEATDPLCLTLEKLIECGRVETCTALGTNSKLYRLARYVE